MGGGAGDEWDALVLVGTVARTQGRHGEVILNAATDFPEERFAAGAELRARRPGQAPERLTVATFRMHQGRPVLRFEGVATMNDAEALAGTELRVSPEAQHALPEGTYYHSALVGCEVVTEAGERVGRVTAVEGEARQSWLVVRGRRGEVLIPLVDAICPQVDVDGKRIVVRPPDGLLELNDRGFADGSPTGDDGAS